MPVAPAAAPRARAVRHARRCACALPPRALARARAAAVPALRARPPRPRQLPRPVRSAARAGAPTWPRWPPAAGAAVAPASRATMPRRRRRARRPAAAWPASARCAGAALRRGACARHRRAPPVRATGVERSAALGLGPVDAIGDGKGALALAHGLVVARLRRSALGAQLIASRLFDGFVIGRLHGHRQRRAHHQEPAASQSRLQGRLR